MSRIIREHRIMGKAIVVHATTEEKARIKIQAMPYSERRDHLWEIKEVTPGIYEGYTAYNEDCFALND